MKNTKSVFSINLIRARKARGWSQQQLAHKLEIKRARLGAYEEGRAEPNHEMLEKICKELCVEDWKGFVTNEQFVQKAE